MLVTLMTSVLPARAAVTATGAVTPTEGSDYVILNLETGLFLRSQAPTGIGGSIGHAARFGTLTEADANYYLWQFKADNSGGYYISNDAISGKYLTDDNTSSTYLGKFEATGTPWYFAKNPYNGEGYLISSNSAVNASDKSSLTHCFYAYYYREDKYYYLCSTDEDPVDQAEHKQGTKKWYFLPTMRIFTYDELYAYAQKSGYSGDKASTVTAAEWLKLTDYVSSTTTATDTQYVSMKSDGSMQTFVFGSRRYHKFLTTDTRDNFHSADKSTTSSIFFASATGTAGERAFTNLYHNDGMTLTLQQVHNGHKNDFYLTDSKGQYLAVDKDGIVSMADFGTSNSGNLANLDRIWVVAANPYDNNEQYINIHMDDINDVQNMNIRIENTGKRIKVISDIAGKATTTADNKAGFLTDVDQAVFRQFDTKYGTTIHKADIFSNTVNIKTAANLWRIIKRVSGSDNDDQAIGIVGNYPHSLFNIQNTNSGKYIGEPVDGSNVMPLVAEDEKESKRALFYFLPKEANNDTGLYAIILFDRNNSAETETPKGYLDIADVDTTSGAILDDPTDGFNQASLIYRSYTDASTAPTAAAAYSWLLHPARFVQVRAVYSDTSKPVFGEKRYATIWFPFDVVNTGSDVKLYYGKWNDPHTSVRFYSTANLPAKHGALMLAPHDDAHEYVRLYLGDATDYPEDISNDVLTGVAEGEDYPLTADSRQKIYVFSETDEDNNDMELRLGHPVDQSLMANRCIVKATTASESVVRSGKEFTFGFGDDMSTDIISPRTIGDKGGTPEYYNLEGIRVEHPAHGIYIHNGKKILVK